MAGQDTTVVYKAIANFTALNSAIDKTKRKVQELRAEEAKANAASLTEADFLAAAQEGRAKSLDGYAKKLKNYKQLLDSVAKAENSLGGGGASKSVKAQSDAVDKLNERLEKMQKLLREQAAPAPPSGGTRGTSDAAKINRIAKAVEGHAAAEAAYTSVAGAANTLRGAEARSYDKLTKALAGYTAARLAANAADKGAVGAPFPQAPGAGASKFGPGAMPPRKRRAAAPQDNARFVTGLDPQTGDLDTSVDRLADAMARLKRETNNFGAGEGFKELSAGIYDSEKAASKFESTFENVRDLFHPGGGGGGRGGGGGGRGFFGEAADGARDFGRGMRDAEKEGTRFSRFFNVLRNNVTGVYDDIRNFDGAIGGLAKKLAGLGGKSFEFLNFGFRAPLVVIITLIGAVISAIDPLVAVLGSAGIAVAGLASNFASLSGVLLALPGILGAVLSAVGAVKIAFGGILGSGGVFALAAQAKKSKGKASAAAARDDSNDLEPLTAAQMKLLNSPDMVAEGLKQADAQLKLNKARKDGKVILDGLVFSQKQLNMLQAQANLQSAKENLANVMADPNSTKGDKLQAEAAYLRAQQAIQNPKKKATAGASTAANDQKAYEDALAKLSPSAQKFVKAIQEIAPAWNTMKNSIQEAFFGEIAKDFDKIKDIIPEIGDLLIPVARAVGKFFDKLLVQVSSPEWASDIQQIGTLFGQIIDVMGDGLIDLLGVIKDLIIAAGPFTLVILGFLADGAKHLKDIVGTAKDDGSLATWLDTVAKRLEQWWKIVSNLAKTIFYFGKALNLSGDGAADFGDKMVKSLDKMTGGWLKNAKEAAKPGSDFQTFLKNIQPLLTQVSGLMGDFFGWFAKTASDPEVIKSATSLVKAIRDAGPQLADFFKSMSDAKLGEQVVKVIGSAVELIDHLANSGVVAALKLILTVLQFLLDVLNTAGESGLLGVLSPFIFLGTLAFAGFFALFGALQAINMMTFGGLKWILKALLGDRLKNALDNLKNFGLKNSAEDGAKSPRFRPPGNPGIKTPGKTGSGTQERPFPNAADADEFSRTGKNPPGWMGTDTPDGPIFHPDPDYVSPEARAKAAREAYLKDNNLKEGSLLDDGVGAPKAPVNTPGEPYYSPPGRPNEDFSNGSVRMEQRPDGTYRAERGQNVPRPAGAAAADARAEADFLARMSKANEAGGKQAEQATKGFWSKFVARLKDLAKNSEEGSSNLFTRWPIGDPARPVPTYDLNDPTGTPKPVFNIDETGPAPRPRAPMPGAPAPKAPKTYNIDEGPRPGDKLPTSPRPAPIEPRPVYELPDAEAAITKGGRLSRLAPIAGKIGKVALNPIGELIGALGKTGIGKAIAGSKIGTAVGTVAKPLAKLLPGLGLVLGAADTVGMGINAATANGGNGDKEFYKASREGRDNDALWRGLGVIGGQTAEGSLNGLGIGTPFGPIGMGIGAAAGAIYGTGTGVASLLGVNNIKKVAGTKNKKLRNSLLGTATGSGQFGGDVLGTAIDIPENAINANKDLNKAFKPVQDWMDSVQKGIGDTWNSFLNGGGKGKNRWPGILHVFEMKNLIKANKRLNEVFKPVQDWMNDVQHNIAGAWEGFLNGDGKKGGWPGALHLFDPKTLGDIQSGLNSFFKPLEDWLNGIQDGVTNWWQSIFGGGAKTPPPTKNKSSFGGGGTFATGGYVSQIGRMSGLMRAQGTDTVPAMLTPGEFVMKKSAVDRIGTAQLHALNSGQAAASYFADGGFVSAPSMGIPSSLSAPSIQQSVSSPTVNDRSIAIHGLVINNPVPESGSKSVARNLRSMAFFGSPR
jgi:hypothetical protein